MDAGSELALDGNDYMRASLERPFAARFPFPQATSFTPLDSCVRPSTDPVDQSAKTSRVIVFESAISPLPWMGTISCVRLCRDLLSHDFRFHKRRLVQFSIHACVPRHTRWIRAKKNRAVVFESAISLLPWTALQFMGFRIRGFIGSHFAWVIAVIGLEHS